MPNDLLAGVRNGAWLDDQVFAGSLVIDGRCSPQCLLATGDDHGQTCRCRCKGAFHGVLTDVPVTAHRDDNAWHEGHHGYGDLHLAAIFSVRDGDTRSFNRFWVECKRTEAPAIWIAHSRHKKRWSAHYDVWSTDSWPVDDESVALLEALIIGLIKHRVTDGPGGPGPETGGIYGLSSEREARIVASAFAEALYDNRSGIKRLVYALQSRSEG